MTGDPTAPGGDLLLTGALLADGRRCDVRLRAGRVLEVRPAGHRPAVPGPTVPPDRVVDLDGWLLLPAPVEPHAHLDKAYTADRVDNPTGDLAGAVAGWLHHRRGLTIDDLTERATAALAAHVRHGATVVRTHVDVGEGIGLRAVEALVRVRESFAGRCAVQLVAFVGVPLTGAAGTEHRALLRAAVDAGADVVGGCPHLDPDPVGYVERCLAVAADRGLPLDLHVDEALDPATPALRALLDVVGDGYPPGVVASHCVGLAAAPVAEARRLAERLAAAQVAVTCLPRTNLYLQGRDHPGPAAGPPRGLPPLRLLAAAGVTVAAGGDNVQDPFCPLGRGDPMETAALLVTAGHLGVADAWYAVTTGARAALGLPPVEVAPGAPADLLAVPAANLREALAETPPERIVLRAGEVVARTSVQRWEELPNATVGGRR